MHFELYFCNAIVPVYCRVEVITLSLTDPVAPAEELGYLQLEIKVLNMTYHEQHAYEQQKLQQSKVCNGPLTMHKCFNK